MLVLLEFVPIVVFFLVYKYHGIYTATAVLMGVTVSQAGYQWLSQGKIANQLKVVLGSVLVLGSATLLFHDQRFIMWKPTLVFSLFAFALILNQALGRRPLLQALMGEEIVLSDKQWGHLNLIWSVFFLGMAFLNTLIISYYDLDTWMHFKLFGILGIMLVFVLAQSALILYWSGSACE